MAFLFGIVFNIPIWWIYIAFQEQIMMLLGEKVVAMKGNRCIITYCLTSHNYFLKKFEWKNFSSIQIIFYSLSGCCVNNLRYTGLFIHHPA